jgi:hypothetical protein
MQSTILAIKDCWEKPINIIWILATHSNIQDSLACHNPWQLSKDKEIVCDRNLIDQAQKTAQGRHWEVTTW